MGALCVLLGLGGVVVAIVGMATGSWILFAVSVVLAVLFFAIGGALIKSAQGMGWIMRGAHSVGQNEVQLGIGQLENAVAILRSRKQFTDLGVAELYLACALAVDGQQAEAQGRLHIAMGLLQDPHNGAYFRKPSVKPQFEHMVQTLQRHLAIGVPDRQTLRATLFG